MISIDIPSDGQSGLTFTLLKKYNIPAPSNGFSSEVNDNVLIKFNDEQQAIDYAHELDAYSNTIDADSIEYSIVNDIIKAIGDDGFIQEYIQT